MPALEEERSFLNANKEELLKTYGGKFLVISGKSVTGAYDTMEQALQGAATTHGLKSVLIRRPSEAQLEFKAPALTLGILRANTIHTVTGTTIQP